MTDIHPINVVIDTPWLSDKLLFGIWLVLSLIISFGLGLIIYFYFREKIINIVNIPVPVIEIKIDYKTEALQALKNLYPEINLKEDKEIYLELTKILKSFLSQTKKIDFIDMTTTETIPNLSELEKDKIKLVLNNMDLAKFANHNLNQARLAESYQDIYNFIDQY